MAIKVLTKKSTKTKRKTTPHYKLVYDYMIGDADGYTKEEVQISLDNPYVEKYCRLLNKLKPVKGTWGLILDEETIKKAYKEKQINAKDMSLLLKLMFEPDYDDDQEEEDQYAQEFFEGVRSDSEYTFLVFQGVSLYYINEYGETQQTNIK